MDKLKLAISKFSWKPFILLSFLYSIVGLVAINITMKFFIDIQLEQHKQTIKQKVELVRFKMESNLYRDAYLTDSLTTLITLTPDFALSNWEAVAGRLLDKATTIVTIGLAPDDVIQKVYPLKGNELALGLDLKSVPEQFKDVTKAKKNKRMYLAGPTELVQGGTGLIARFPIFSDPPYNTKYWGGLSVVIDYIRLLELSGILDLQGISPNLIKDGDVIFGQHQSNLIPDFTYPIYIPNGTWYINGYLKEGDIISVKKLKCSFYTIAFTIFAIIYVLLILLYLNYDKVRALSFTDALTGLPNRRYFLKELDRISCGDNEHLEVALLTIDLNDFKLINDTFGHKVGDEALITVGDTLRASVRTSDIVARLGGDEFVILLHRFQDEDSLKKIVKNIKEKKLFVNFKGKEVLFSSSIGYSFFKGIKQNFCVEKLVTESDKSMYLDKTRKNTF